jgi:diadenylate cyclase
MDQLQELDKKIIADVETTLLFNPTKSQYNKWKNDVSIIVVGIENSFDEEQFIGLPLEFQNASELFRFGLTGALDHEFITGSETVICAAQLFSDSIDSFTRINADRIETSKLYDFFYYSRAEQSVIKAILELAIGLGKSGQKGKPVGALFSIGDAGTVMNSSRSLSYNPFDQSHVHAGDPIVSVMLKEFSRLDGAFVISGAGKIVSAYQYLEPSINNLDIPKGLGTRHNAAAAITDETEAVTIVLSEGDSRVRGFKNGDLIFNIDPDQY